MGFNDDDNQQPVSSKKKNTSFKKMGAQKLSGNQSEASGDETTHSDRIHPIKPRGDSQLKQRTDKRKLMNALNQNYELYGAEDGVDKFLKEKTSEDKSMYLTKDEFVNI